MKTIVFDTETTGLDPADGHKLVEIGCVELENSVRTGKVYHQYIHPERDMPYEAYNVHGISEAFLADKPKFHEIANDLMEFIGDSKLIAHNAGFDVNFLNYELQAISQPKLSNEIIDTLQIARERYPGGQNSLDALCRRFKIDSSKRTKHGALLDAELLVEVYLHLEYGEGQINIFAVNSEKKQRHKEEKKKLHAESFKNRIFKVQKPLKEEVDEYMKFMEKIVQSEK